MRDFAYVVRYLHSALRWRLFVWLTLIVLASALEGVTLGLFLPIIAGTDSDSPLQRIITSAFDNLGIQYTLPLALGAMTALYALRTALVITQEIFVARQIAGLMVDIKSRMVDQLLRADYQYFTKRGVGFFNNAATVEFTNLTNAFDYSTRAMVAAGFTVTYVVLALVVNPVLAVAFLIFAVPAYFLLRTAFSLVQRVSTPEHRKQLPSSVPPDPDAQRLQVLQGDRFDTWNMGGRIVCHRRAGTPALSSTTSGVGGAKLHRPADRAAHRRTAVVLRRNVGNGLRGNGLHAGHPAPDG